MTHRFYHVIEPARNVNGYPLCGQFNHKNGASYTNFAEHTTASNLIPGSGGYQGVVVVTLPYGVSHDTAWLCGWGSDEQGEPAGCAWSTDPKEATLGLDGWPYGPNFFTFNELNLQDLDNQSNQEGQGGGQQGLRLLAGAKARDAPGGGGNLWVGFACPGALALATNGGKEFVASAVHSPWEDPPMNFKGGTPPACTHLQGGQFVYGFGDVVCHEMMAGELSPGRAALGVIQGKTIVTRMILSDDARLYGVGIVMAGGLGYLEPSAIRGCIYDEQIVDEVAHPHALVAKTRWAPSFPGIVQPRFEDDVLLASGTYWVGASFAALDVACGIGADERPEWERCVSCPNGLDGPPSYFGLETEQPTHLSAAMLGRPGLTQQPMVMCV